MTISSYIVQFLKGFENIKIDTNHVSDGSDKYGLFKSPSRDFKRNVDGSALITEYYQFFAFQKSISESERKEDDEWLEDFTYWLDDYPLKHDYPTLDQKRKVYDIKATGNPTPQTDTESGIMYMITLQIAYEREV